MNEIIAAATAGLPALPDTDYLIGLGHHGRRHAVAYLAARDAYDQAAVLREAGHRGVGPTARPVCADTAGSVLVAAKLGTFDRTNPRLRAREARVCAACAWAVAARRGRLGDELDAQQPTGTDRTVLRAALGDPDLLVVLCRAVLLADTDIDHAAHECAVAAANDGDADAWALLTEPAWEITGPHGPPQPHPETLARLAHLCEHAVDVGYPIDCLDGGCDHDRPDQHDTDDQRHDGDGGPDCGGAEASVHCAGCTLSAGGWAGEYEGGAVLTVPGPCGVLAAAGEQLGVPVPHAPTATATPTAPEPTTSAAPQTGQHPGGGDGDA